jgi:AhpD family alkylhydroperoxidase
MPQAVKNFVRMFRVLVSARENRMDLPGWLVRRPALLAGIAAAEAGGMLSNRLDRKLKMLAEFRVAALVGCEFCLDIGAALAEHSDLDERQLTELHDFETSDAFDDDERLVLRLATVLSEVPARVPDELRRQLLSRFAKAQLVELAATIAHEHERTRLYIALGIRPARFASADACRVRLVHGATGP